MGIEKMDAFREFSDVEWENMVNDCFLAWIENNDDVRGTTIFDLVDWFDLNKDAEPAASLTDNQICDLIRAIHNRCLDFGLVYAVQRESWEPWDDCYDTFEEALEEAEWKDCDIICVIDISKKDPICVQELHRYKDF